VKCGVEVRTGFIDIILTSIGSRRLIIFRGAVNKKAKAVPLHAMKALGGEEV
jgi:hypothetical protein